MPAEELQGKVKTTIKDLLALENVKSIRELAEETSIKADNIQQDINKIHPQNSGLVNQSGMGVIETEGKPIIWYFKNDEYGNRNLFIATYKESEWFISKTTNVIGKAVLQGEGTIDFLGMSKKVAYSADYGNVVIYVMDKMGRKCIIEFDANCQVICKETILPEYESGNENNVISKKRGSFVTQATQRTLFDKNLPQSENGNGTLTVYC